MTTFRTSAKMQPPRARRRAFDATRSAWLGRRVDTIPLGLHRPPSDFRLLQLLLIAGRTREALFDCLDLSGFWPGLQDWSGFGLRQPSGCAALRLGCPRRARRPMRIRPPEPQSPECTRSPQMLSCVLRRLAVSEVRLALPNFYNITVRIANVAARLAVLVL